MKELVKAPVENILGNFVEVPDAESLDIASQIISFWEELDNARNKGQNTEQLRAIYDRNLSRCMAVWQAKVLMCLREKGLTTQDVVRQRRFVQSTFGDRKITVMAKSSHDFDVSFKVRGISSSTLKYTPGALVIVPMRLMESHILGKTGQLKARYYVDFGSENRISIGKQEYIYSADDKNKVISKGEHIEFTNSPLSTRELEFDNY